MKSSATERFSPLILSLVLMLAIVGTIFVGCVEDQIPTGTEQITETPTFAKSDGTDASGNPGFFFWPPIVPNPVGADNYDPDGFNQYLQPAVEICELVGLNPGVLPLEETECADPQPDREPWNQERIRFEFGESGGVNLYPDEELYKLEWHTDDYNLNTGRFYRIFVLVARAGSAEEALGFVDVNPVTSREMKSAKTGEVFALKDGRTLPIKFRIEADWLCDPLSDYCAAEVITASEGGTVTAGTGDEVYVPPQEGGFPVAGGGTVDQITVTVDVCSEPAVLPIDIPQYGECLEVTAEPALDPDEPLPTPAIVAMCSAEGDDFGLTVNNPWQWQLLTMHRWDDQGTGDVFALSHAEYACSGLGMNLDESNGFMRFAKAGWKTLSDGFERVLAPTPLMANRPPVMHHGPAGPTGFFSKFRLALPSKIEIVDGDGQAVLPGDQVPVDPKVKVTDLRGDAVKDALVRVNVISNDGQIGLGGTWQTTEYADSTDPDGFFSIGWKINSEGLNKIEMSGFGIADARDGFNGPRDDAYEYGPFDPFMPLDPDWDDGDASGMVLLKTGAVEFTASGAVDVCDDLDPACTQEVVSAGEETTVEVDTDNNDQTPGDRVFFPIQPNGYPIDDGSDGVEWVDNVSVIMKACEDEGGYPIDIPVDNPVHGDCLDISLEPPLAEGYELTEAAIVSMCSANDPNNPNNSDPFGLGLTAPYLTLHRYDDGQAYALPHADELCGFVVGATERTGLMRYAHVGLDALRSGVRKLLPAPLHADRPMVMHHGPAGPSTMFSLFQLAVPVKMIPESPANRTLPTGTGAATTVRILDLMDNPVEGATVHFGVTTGWLDQPTDVSDEFGLASVRWTTAGDGIATAGGLGIASSNANGPRTDLPYGPIDPFMPFDHDFDGIDQPDPRLDVPVQLDDGELTFEMTEAEVTEPEVTDGLITFNRTVTGNTDVFVIYPDGTGETPLTNDPAIDAGPAWSPDGMQIAFQSRRESEPTTADIWVMNADGSSPVNLTHDPATFQLTPTWSPDGSQIAFMNRTGGDQVWVMNSDGTGVPTLIAGPTIEGDAGFPCWSPDGTKIAFTSTRGGRVNPDIFIMDSDGSDQTPLTDDPAYDLGCAWSPDGSKIAFISRRDGNMEVYTMNADGSNQINLSNSPGIDRIGGWSPSGEFFVFDSYRHEGPRQIYVMNSDGNEVTRISFSGQEESGAEWGTLHQVPLVVPQTWLVDLETATLLDLPSSPNADVWFHAVSDTERYLEPFNSATMAVYGATRPGKSGCLGLALSADPVPVENLPTGTFVCVLTVEGNMAEVEILQEASPSPGEMTIGIRVFP